MRHFNREYDGSPLIPKAAGDRIYAQDLLREFEYLEEIANGNFAESCGGNVILSGLEVRQGNGDYITITPGTGIVKSRITIPSDYGSFPPSTVDIDTWKRIQVPDPGVVDHTIPSAVLDNVTINFVCLTYAESDGYTRQRAKAAGTYAYEKEPGYGIRCSPAYPNAYEMVLGAFTGFPGNVWYWEPYVAWQMRVDTITSLTAVPVGTYIMTAVQFTPYGNVVVMPGYLFCEGQEVNIADYPRLYQVLRTTYGGDGVTTFGIPDMREYFPRGMNKNGVGADPDHASRTAMAGLQPTDIGSTQAGVVEAHAHGFTDPGHAHGVADPTHNHLISDPGHYHNLTDPGHGHTGVTATHGHSVSDPGHAHTDSGHDHPTVPNTGAFGITVINSSVAGSYGFYSGAFGTVLLYGYNTGTGYANIQSNTTGLTVDNNAGMALTATANTTGATVDIVATGVYSNANGTGVSVNAASTGASVNSHGGNETRPINRYVGFYIKT